jgi:hypothetical protein
MEPKQLTDAQNALLAKPLPKEAISPHPTKKYLSTIKAIYVVERLNQVFGVGQWFINPIAVAEATEKMVVILSEFRAPDYGIVLQAYGGNDNSDRGDAYKGAVTDALTKIGSYLGIGMDVFKGFGDKAQDKPQPTEGQTLEQTLHYNAFLSDIKDARDIKKDLMAIHSEALTASKKGEITEAQRMNIVALLSQKKEELKANG